MADEVIDEPREVAEDASQVAPAPIRSTLSRQASAPRRAAAAEEEAADDEEAVVVKQKKK